MEFDVPIIQENECVILMFRSIGKIRDVRQTDHPFGLIYALNQESKSPSFKKVLGQNGGPIFSASVPSQISGAAVALLSLVQILTPSPIEQKRLSAAGNFLADSSLVFCEVVGKELLDVRPSDCFIVGGSGMQE